MRRRTALTCIATGALGLVASVLLPVAASAQGVVAAAEPGSGFGSFNLSAAAPGVQVRFDDGGNCSARNAGTGGCEGVIPETVSTLRNGPIGYGLSAVVWPGVLAGNVGSVILAANSSAPNEVTMLNSPVRAEARTGSGPDTVTNSQYPGTTMVATAKDDIVTTRADVASSQSAPVGTFGHTTSASSVKLTGAAMAVADASSRVDDISLAGGQITIGSVSSVVQGTTDGAKATGKGKTVVNDVRIAGVPVTIDDRGITVQDQNNPVNATAAAAVNQVVTNMGMTVAVSQPSGKPEGGKIVYNAGSLVMSWKTDGGTFTVIFGGAAVALAAVTGDALNFNLDLDTAPVDSGGFTPAAPTGSAGAPVTGGLSAPGPVTGGGAAPAVAAPEQALTPTLAGQGVPLPGPPSPAYLVLGLFGATLLLAGMRQLPDRVLEARVSSCLLGETR